jgi:hypothetical protein
MATQQEHLENINRYREYYNRELNDIGFEAPTPKADQKSGNYRRTALQHFADRFLPQYHELAKVNYLDIPYDILKVFEPQLLKACVVEYQNPNNVPPGELREIKKKDGFGHLQAINYIGQDWFGRLHNFGVKTDKFNWLGGHRPGRVGRIRNPDRDRGWFTLR